MHVSYGKAQLNRRKGGVERIEDELVNRKQVRLSWRHRADDEYLLYFGASVTRLIVQELVMLKHVGDVVEEEENILRFGITVAAGPDRSDVLRRPPSLSSDLESKSNLHTAVQRINVASDSSLVTQLSCIMHQS